MQNKLTPTLFKQAEHETMRWVAYPEAGTPVELILKPEYWSHVARQMQPWNRIEVRAADGSYLIDLVVLACGPLWAKVAVLSKHEFGSASGAVAAPTIEDDEFKVEWGGAAKWRVRRKTDGEVMVQDLDKDGANAWVAKYRRQVAA